MLQTITKTCVGCSSSFETKVGQTFYCPSCQKIKYKKDKKPKILYCSYIDDNGVKCNKPFTYLETGLRKFCCLEHAKLTTKKNRKRNSEKYREKIKNESLDNIS